MSRLPAPPQGGAIELALQALRRFGRLRLRAHGSSMLPSVLPGDVLEFESLERSEACVGDVVLFRRGEGLVIHRVVERMPDRLRTRGDGLPHPDEPVAHSDVLGRLVAQRRGDRKVQGASSRTVRITRWLFGRSSLAVRLYLRWHRPKIRTAG